MGYETLKRNLLSDDLVYTGGAGTTATAGKKGFPKSPPRPTNVSYDIGYKKPYVAGENEVAKAREVDSRQKANYQIDKSYALPFVVFEQTRKEEEYARQNSQYSGSGSGGSGGGNSFVETKNTAAKEGDTAEKKTDVMEYVKWGAIGTGAVIVLALILSK